MGEEKLLGFDEFCHEWIRDHLENYLDQSVYADELGWTLTECPNVDGSFTYSTYKARQYIKEWWDDAAEYYEYEKAAFGMNLHNPFEEPEAFTVCMLVQGVESIIAQTPTIQDNWSETIILTEELVDQILSEIDNCHVEW